MRYNFLAKSVYEFDELQNVGDINLSKAFDKKPGNFKAFLQQAEVILKNIVACEKKGETKEVKQWHEKLDKLLHAFVGKEGLTAEEKKK